MRRFRVSSFLADVTQQIHSFRASGVIAAHRLFAAASESMALRRSDGSLWIVPPVIASVVMHRLRRVSCRLNVPHYRRALPLRASGYMRLLER
jgi:hypothetical protein